MSQCFNFLLLYFINPFISAHLALRKSAISFCSDKGIIIIFIWLTFLSLSGFLKFLTSSLSVITKNLCFGQTPSIPVWELHPFVFRSFCRKETFVNLNLTHKGILTIAFIHGITKLVQHLSYRLIAFVPELTLKIYRGKRVLCRNKQMHYYEPVLEGQLGILHDRTLLRRLSL